MTMDQAIIKLISAVGTLIIAVFGVGRAAGDLKKVIDAQKRDR